MNTSARHRSPRCRSAALLLAIVFLWTMGIALMLHQHNTGTRGAAPGALAWSATTAPAAVRSLGTPRSTDSDNCVLCQWMSHGASALALATRVLTSAPTVTEASLPYDQGPCATPQEAPSSRAPPQG